MDRIGRYRIVKELGRGAMGVVYQAVDPTIGRTLAIKTIRLREVDDPAQRARLKERLFREARSAGVLSHPNIVTIYDMEEDDGLAYIAMQFVNGPTLDEVMSRPKAMDAQEMFRILRQTASGLDFAHEKGIVHRDIKPANIMIDEHGTAKIADFGIAKVGTSGNLTLSGTILGTPNYMSPEQVQGKAVDGRADQFSLAVVAYEILTGERPFGGEHLGTVVYRIVAEEPAVVHRLNPSLSQEIDAVIRKALSKKPDERYGACTEFVNALEGACLHADGWQSLARGTGHTISTEVEPAARTREPRTERIARKKGRAAQEKSMFYPALGAFVVVLGVLALLAWQSGLWQPPGTSGEPKQAAKLDGKTETPKSGANADSAADDVETPPPAPEPPKSEEAKVDTPKTGPPSRSASQIAEPSQRQPAQTQPAQTQPAEPVPSVVRKAAQPLPVAKAPMRLPGQTQIPAQGQSAAGGPQDIYVQTNPSGATAVLDRQVELGCETPCLLLASPGSHILSVTLGNYQKEIRQIKVADSRVDIPLITMQPNGGTLMISTSPTGANIYIDDRLMGSVTNAQVSLPAGSYTVRVELNGVRKSQKVDVANGNTNYVKFILNP